MDRRHVLTALSLVAVLAASAALWPGGERTGRNTAVQCDRDNAPLHHFAARNPGRAIIKWAMRDLNDDGREDLLVIYRVDAEKNMMRVVLDLGGGFGETNEVPAPHSNQVISFRDIDGKPPVEIVVQGTKGVKFGYAVFRVEGTELTDLFGDGMDGCC